jgi:hypothetical protein
MGDIEMLGGSDFHLNHSKEEGAAQHGGGSGDVEMYGGSNLHLSHTPEGSEQKGGGGGDIQMIGLQGLVNKSHIATPYGSDRPTDHGKE